jgi:hypothetical protein
MRKSAVEWADTGNALTLEQIQRIGKKFGFAVIGTVEDPSYSYLFSAPAFLVQFVTCDTSVELKQDTPIPTKVVDHTWRPFADLKMSTHLLRNLGATVTLTRGYIHTLKIETDFGAYTLSALDNGYLNHLVGDEYFLAALGLLVLRAAKDAT